jgi:hypothetical protein
MLYWRSRIEPQPDRPSRSLPWFLDLRKLHVPAIAIVTGIRTEAAWTGGHDNPHWTHYERDIVHFLDTDLTALQLTAPRYRSLTKASSSKTSC